MCRMPSFTCSILCRMSVDACGTRPCIGLSVKYEMSVAPSTGRCPRSATRSPLALPPPLPLPPPPSPLRMGVAERRGVD